MAPGRLLRYSGILLRVGRKFGRSTPLGNRTDLLRRGPDSAKNPMTRGRHSTDGLDESNTIDPTFFKIRGILADG